MQYNEFIDHLLKSISYSKKVTDITRHNFEMNLRANFERLFSKPCYPNKDELTNCLEDVLFGMCMEEVVYFRYDVLNFKE